MAETKAVVVAIVRLCHEAGDWKALNEHIVLLAKRRAQIKNAVADMVKECMLYVDAASDIAKKVELIETLNTVTEGKIYVEIERARLVRQLARIKEEQGKIKEAAEVLQGCAVETFGAMHRREKIAFILEQVRLCLDHKDFMRAQILSKKINPRTFKRAEKAAAKVRRARPARVRAPGAPRPPAGRPTDAAPARPPAREPQEGEKGKKEPEPLNADAVIQEPVEGTPELEALKVTYYEHMARYHASNNDYLEMCRCHMAVYDTPSVKAEPLRWKPLLEAATWYVLLAPSGPEQDDLVRRLHSDKSMDELAGHKALLKTFITKEIIHWSSLQATHKPQMDAAAAIFGGDAGAKRLEDLRLRIVEHNLLVVVAYYSKITLQRLATLLSLEVAEAEKHLSDMVVAGRVAAKIDRPAGTVLFGGAADPARTLSSWATTIEKLLHVVDRTCHQIHKERVTHGLA